MSKNNVISVLVVGGVMAFLSSGAFAETILESFEYADEAEMYANGWTITEGSGLTLTTDVAHSGAKAVKADGSDLTFIRKEFFAEDQVNVDVSIQWYYDPNAGFNSRDSMVNLREEDGGPGTYGIYLRHQSNHRFICRVGDGSYIWSGGVFQVGWNVVRVSYDEAGSADVYFNGQYQTTYETTGFHSVTLGRTWYFDESYDVAWDDLTIVPKPVTPLFSYPGWQIYENGGNYGYRYGPSIIINSDKSIDIWLSSPGNGSTEWDWIRHKKSTDGGLNWGSETIALRPTPGSADHFSCCDPGVFYYGGYYYIGYTSTTVGNGTENNVFVARSTSPTGGFQKWNGSGWGGNPQPFIVYDGPSGHYGCGEPSFVVLGDTLYIYYTYVGSTGAELKHTRVCTAFVNNSNWPGSITYQGKAMSKVGQGSADVKYVDGMGKFIAIAEGRQFQPDSYIRVWESYDGLTFNLSNELTDYIQPYCHNTGISGRCDGHLTLGRDNFIAYAYGPDWGAWDTFLNPIHFNELIAVKKYDTGSNKTEAHVMSGLNNFSSFILQIGTALHVTNSDWQFIVSDWDDDTKADLFAIREDGSPSGKVELHILDRATNYQTYLLNVATVLICIDPDKWKFDLADWNGDGVQDLFGIFYGYASGKTEVHIMNGADNFQSWLYRVATTLHPVNSNWDFEASDYNNDGTVDLFCINRTGASEKTEVHILNGADNFQSYLINIATALHVTNANWTFEVTDWNNDDYADVIAIRKIGSSGKTEVYILNGSSNFQDYLLHTTTALGSVGDNFELLISSFEE